jgi:hypothetical protein
VIYRISKYPKGFFPIILRQLNFVTIGFCTFFLPFLSMNHVMAESPSLPEAMSRSEFQEQVTDEYQYRKALENEAPKWARDLMYLYQWEVRYGVSYHSTLGRYLGSQPSKEEISQRLNSEVAWMVLLGHGLVATFDFKHAEQTLLGSTSRLVAALTKSRAFWREVKAQCLSLEEYGKVIGGSGLDVKSCADRLSSDLRISQLVGSNVSLFVGGGVVVGLGKKVFTKYFSAWFAQRVVPMLPVAARSRWVLGGLTAAVVVLPTSFLYAALEKERETSKEFLENLPELLKETEDLRLKDSIMRRQALELERDVVAMAIWINQRLASSSQATSNNSLDGRRASPSEVQMLLMDLKMFGPGYTALVARREQAELVRNNLEQELSRLPDSRAYLLNIFEKKRLGVLNQEEKTLLRKTQYLAALRLVLPLLISSEGH